MDTRQAICQYLLWALQMTRGLRDLVGLRYQDDGTVQAVFRKGERSINVGGDSEIMMIKDIIAALE